VTLLRTTDLRSKLRGEIDGIEQSSNANKLGLYCQFSARHMSRIAHVDTSEMGLIRQLNTIRINMFLNCSLITTTTSSVDVVDRRLDRYPSQT